MSPVASPKSPSRARFWCRDLRGTKSVTRTGLCGRLLNRDSSKVLQVKQYYSACTRWPKTAAKRRRFGPRLQHIQVSQVNRGSNVTLVEGGGLVCCQSN